MAEQVEVNTDRMGQGLQTFINAGNDMLSIYHTLFAAANELDGCWGDDETGQQFAEGYLPSAQQVLQGIDTGGATVTGTGQGIETMIAGYDETEEDNIRAVSGPFQTPGIAPDPIGSGDGSSEHDPVRG